MSLLKSEKVFLRTVEKDDLSLVLRWFNDAEVIQYLQMYLPMTRVAEEKWLERVGLSETNIVFVIEVKTEEGGLKPIGTCGLHDIKWKDRQATIGIAIGEKDFWDGGFGTEAVKLLVEYAFFQLNLNRINSSVYDFNKRSLAMQKKVGFSIEGRRRQAIFKNGAYDDEIVLGLLRTEFKK